MLIDFIKSIKLKKKKMLRLFSLQYNQGMLIVLIYLIVESCIKYSKEIDKLCLKINTIKHYGIYDLLTT